MVGAPPADVRDRVATTGIPAVERLPQSLGDVAVPLRAVSADDMMADVEVLFRAPSCAALAVQGDGAAPVGLLTRHRFTAAMTGRLGYGRAVLTRRPVGQIADWSPLVLDAATTVVDAARAAMARAAGVRHDDVLVPGPSWSAASTADLVSALTAAVSQRAARDPLTGVLSRPHLMATAARWAAEALPGTRRRLLLAAVDVVRMEDINATHGLDAGDALLRELASRVASAAPSGAVTARLDGDAFAVLVLLPAVPEERAQEIVGTVRDRLRGACATLGAGVRVATTASTAGWADATLLLLEVERDLRTARTAGTAPHAAPLQARR
ncbi:diguanylate cyclase domain-containing protein [Cellulomonas sp. S1-8]|uniref:diguanylate cyclase domain-containing protein n=1 Tax=Cellulomonas sp. S1-8 TaxID=2904790 RepID=UPI002244BB68|nr:diguanylate cyclase [Cellulomonas sp. S1-8]UZN02730.1 diguanylate cyclase [Cellulomonas sp. S1-8]